MSLKAFFTGGPSVDKAREDISQLETRTNKLKFKEQRRLDNARRITRAHALKLILGGVVTIGGAITGGVTLFGKNDSQDTPSRTTPSATPVSSEDSEKGLRGSRSKITPIQPIVLTGKNDFEQMLQFEEGWKKISFDALSSFQNADPSMPVIVEFMKQNAFYSIPVGPITTQHVALGTEEEVLKVFNN